MVVHPISTKKNITFLFFNSSVKLKLADTSLGMGWVVPSNQHKLLFYYFFISYISDLKMTHHISCIFSLILCLFRHMAFIKILITENFLLFFLSNLHKHNEEMTSATSKSLYSYPLKLKCVDDSMHIISSVQIKL